MGKRKIGFEYIKNNNARLESFQKRTRGLIKKAMELSILCA